MKLFTKSDLERCARLACLHKLVESDPELAIVKAVAAVSEDAPLYYDEATVKLMLQWLLEKEDVELEFEEALNAVRQL